MTIREQKESDRFLTILVLLWVLSIGLVGIGILFRSYTPVPASAMIAGTVQTLAMVMLIIASIAGCIYVALLIHRSE
ncbi:MAG TPA: hypothetical protein VMS89_06180 [Methanoregulaceae archaeon]|nr:hypothetical protein [Methanoregulaceae archaeon]